MPGRPPADAIVANRSDAALYLLYVVIIVCLLAVFAASWFVAATGKAAAVLFVLVVVAALTRRRLQRRVERRLGARFPEDSRTYAVRDRNFDRLDVLRRAILLLIGPR